jgi:Ca-activated chloride channel family protein
MEPAPEGGGEGMNRTLLWVPIVLGLVLTARIEAQSVRSLVNKGNDLYKEGKYTDAEVNYRKALEKDQALLPGKFNLGNALHKEGKLDDAVKQYETTLQPGTPAGTRAKAHYNIGNSHLRQQKYQEAIHSYVESLKLSPDDYDAKYNLSYALRMLRQQQQQQQNKDQNKQDQKKQDQKKDQQQQQQKQDQQQPQQQRQQEKHISKADAQRILDVLKNNERDVQKKLRARPAARPRTEKDW